MQCVSSVTGHPPLDRVCLQKILNDFFSKTPERHATFCVINIVVATEVCAALIKTSKLKVCLSRF